MYSQYVSLRLKTWLCSAIRAVAGLSGHLKRRAYFGCHLGCYIIVLFTGHGLIISTALFGEQTDSCRHWSDQCVSLTRLRLFDVY